MTRNLAVWVITKGHIVIMALRCSEGFSVKSGHATICLQSFSEPWAHSIKSHWTEYSVGLEYMNTKPKSTEIANHADDYGMINLSVITTRAHTPRSILKLFWNSLHIILNFSGNLLTSLVSYLKRHIHPFKSEWPIDVTLMTVMEVITIRVKGLGWGDT